MDQVQLNLGIIAQVMVSAAYASCETQ